MTELGYKHHPAEWRLFIDSRKQFCCTMGTASHQFQLVIASKEKKLMTLLNYSTYNWKVCGDLKVISLLSMLQLGYTKHMCFLCLWDSRQDSKHFDVKDWPPRQNTEIGRYVKHPPLINPENVFLPPLHIKLGLMKNFVKVMNKDGEGFWYITAQFGPQKSEAKLKAGIFVGPEIRKLMLDDSFQMHLSTVELAAWESFKSVKNFFENFRHEQYARIVEDMLKAYKNGMLYVP